MERVNRKADLYSLFRETVNLPPPAQHRVGGLKVNSAQLRLNRIGRMQINSRINSG